jgi:hypothetical protein
MGINQPSFIAPRQEVRSEKKKEKSWVERVVEGLQIANGITGVVSDYQSIQNVRETRDQRQRLAEGRMKKGEANEAYFSQGFTKAAPGEAPDLTFTDADSNEPVGLRAPKKKEDKSPLITWVDGVRGGKAGKIQYVDGKPSEVFEAAAPAAPKEDKTPGNTADLRKEYNNHPVTKATGIMASSLGKIQKTVEAPDAGGAGDISLVYSFMKMNDPESAVREGEYATAENSGGVSDKIRNMYNKMIDGERLTPAQRAAFAGQAQNLMAAQLERQAEQDERYGALAKQFGLDPQFVIDPAIANIRKSLAPGGQAPKQTQTPGEAFAAPDGKVMVSNGKETLMIDAADVADAVKDGFSPVQPKTPRGASGGF